MKSNISNCNIIPNGGGYYLSLLGNIIFVFTRRRFAAIAVTEVFI
jgi:hypothetical protein